MVELVDTQDLKSCDHCDRAGSSPASSTSPAKLQGFFVMKHIVYAISSIERNYIYVGLTSNLEERIIRHNSGYERTSKPYAPFQLIYTEECSNRLEARQREKYWKSGIGKERLRAIRDRSAGLSTDR